MKCGRSDITVSRFEWRVPTSSIATPKPIAVYAASARLNDAKFSIARRSVISKTMFAGVRPAADSRLPTSTSMNAES